MKFEPHKDDFVSDEKISIPLFMLPFCETFHKTGYRAFEHFLKKNAQHDKWIIFSDYVFDDSNKPNDVAVFSIVPGPIGMELIKNGNILAQSDLKKTRSVNPAFVECIKNSPIFTVSVIFPRPRRFCEKPEDERNILQDMVSGLQAMLKIWETTTPESKKRYIAIGKRLNMILQDFNNKEPKLKMMRDIFLITPIVAFLMHEITSHINVSTIGWFSDRDKLLDYQRNPALDADTASPAGSSAPAMSPGNSKVLNAKNSPLIHELINIYFHIFSNREPIIGNPKICFGLPKNEDDSKKMWYDNLIRIADYICGTLADCNLENATSSADKFDCLMKTLLANNEYIQVFQCEFLYSPAVKRLGINLKWE